MKYPIKKEKLFYPTSDINGNFTYYRSMPTDRFPEVTFENSPMEVELTLKVQNYESMDSKR